MSQQHFDLSGYLASAEIEGCERIQVLTPAAQDKPRPMSMWQKQIEDCVSAVQNAKNPVITAMAPPPFLALLAAEVSGCVEVSVANKNPRTGQMETFFFPKPGKVLPYTVTPVDSPSPEGLKPAFHVFFTANPAHAVTDEQKEFIQNDMHARGYHVDEFIRVVGSEVTQDAVNDLQATFWAIRHARVAKGLCFSTSAPQPYAYAFGLAFAPQVFRLWVGYDAPNARYGETGVLVVAVENI